MTEKEKALAGLEFIRGDRDLKLRRDRAEELCFRYNNTSPADAETRSTIIRQLIPDAGENCTVKSPFCCDYGDFIKLGKNFFSNYNVKLIDGGPITFGDNVMVGPDCTFVTPSHAVDPEKRVAGYMIYKPITVGNNVWFGAGVTVCGGVTIGDNAVIGAGSVVVKDIPANCLAVGNPCKVLRQVKENDRKEHSDV